MLTEIKESTVHVLVVIISGIAAGSYACIVWKFRHCPRQNTLLSSCSSVRDLEYDYGQNITMHHLMSHTIFLSMWDLQILFGLWDSLVRRPSTECQLCEDSGNLGGSLNEHLT